MCFGRKYCWLLLFALVYLPNSSSNEEYDYDEQPLSYQRMQQIIQAPDFRWNESNQQSKVIDVREELEKLNITYIYQHEWPDQCRKLGSVSAVTFDVDGNVVIFQRGDRIWDQGTFNELNQYTQQQIGPITDKTVIAYNRSTGKVVYEWGDNKFYMPHGLTIDHENNIWVTDVALHQVMKFGPKGSDTPLMTLGSAFEPGSSHKKFCKPTAVAVLPNGDFFVADGYCNARIIKFSKNGEILLSWGRHTFQGRAMNQSPPGHFAVPHALTLAMNNTLICVADRENGRVQCFYSSNGDFYIQYHSAITGERIFSVDYTSAGDDRLFVVNGPIDAYGFAPKIYNEVRGFEIDMRSGQIFSKFGTNGLEFSNPHDIAVSSDGNEIYVAELSPPRVHKFLHKDAIPNKVFLSAAKPTATLGDSTEIPQNVAVAKIQPGSTALLVISLIVIFGFLTFGLALLISRRRKRGCFPFGVRNRRHAWDFPNVAPDGFKLGNFLDRKRGFEKLDQNASDEEADASTNMLTTAQFA